MRNRRKPRGRRPFYGWFRVDRYNRAMGKLRAFWKDETAIAAIEYGLITAGVSVLIIAAVCLYRPTH
jgi:hypothetical protein